MHEAEVLTSGTPALLGGPVFAPEAKRLASLTSI